MPRLASRASVNVGCDCDEDETELLLNVSQMRYSKPIRCDLRMRQTPLIVLLWLRKATKIANIRN